MDAGLRIIDEFTTSQVFRAREDTSWRSDAKRASLDLLCADCRAITDDSRCTTHSEVIETPTEGAVAATA